MNNLDFIQSDNLPSVYIPEEVEYIPFAECEEVDDTNCLPGPEQPNVDLIVETGVAVGAAAVSLVVLFLHFTKGFAVGLKREAYQLVERDRNANRRSTRNARGHSKKRSGRGRVNIDVDVPADVDVNIRIKT